MRLQSTFLFGATLILPGLLPYTFADIYLQNPCGSNDRLNEQDRNVQNNARLWDSQNNNRGGCEIGEKSLQLYAGSILPLSWSAQHACGGTQDNCDLVIQYMTDYDSNNPTAAAFLSAAEKQNGLKLRDGTATTSPANNNNSDQTQSIGLHETRSFYNDCKTTQRNGGLFTSNQAVQNNIGETSTIQNAAGNQSGLECPEERDYYPWWQPSPWKDVALITTSQKRCDDVKGQSFNVADRYKCVLNNNNNKPITQAACQTAGGQWTKVQAWGLPEPECIVNTENSRDNQHSVVQGSDGNAAGYNFVVPTDAIGKKMIIRIRYNISTGEFADPATGVQDNGLPPLDSKQNAAAAGGADNYPIGKTLGFDNQKDAAARQYDLQGNPQVQPLSAAIGITNANIKTQLAVNTAQWPRTFEDRTYTIDVLDPATNPDVAAALSGGFKVVNLNIAGKMGNDVQVYPQLEESFSQAEINVKPGDVLHVQWSLSKYNVANNAGNGLPQPNADGSTTPIANGVEKANLVMVAKETFNEVGSDPNNPFQLGDKSRILAATLSTDSKNNLFGLSADQAALLAAGGQSLNMVIPIKTEGVWPIMSTLDSSLSNGQPVLKALVTSQGASMKAYTNSITAQTTKSQNKLALAKAAPLEGSPLYNSQIVQSQTPASPAYQGGTTSDVSSSSSSGPNYVLIGGIAGGVVGVIVGLFFLYTCCLKGSSSQKSVTNSKYPSGSVAKPAYAQTYAPVQYTRQSPSQSPRSQQYGTSRMPPRPAKNAYV